MSRLARNIVYNLSGQLTLLVLAIVSAKYIAGHLGKDVLGIIYFSVMMNALISAFLQAGISATTVKEIAAHENDIAYVTKIVRSGAFFYWIAYALVAVAIVVLTPWFVHHWITLETLSPDIAIQVLRILGASTVLLVPMAFYVSVFRGLQRVGIPNLIEVGSTALQQAGIVAIIAISHDVILVAWWMAATYALRLALCMLITAKAFGWGALVPRLDGDVVRRNRSFILHMTAVSVLATIHMQADKFVISTLLPVAGIGVYGLLYSTVARGGVVTGAISQGAFPTLSELVVGGDRDKLLQKYDRLQNLLAFGLAPLYAAITFATLPLFSLVLDPVTASDLVLPAGLLAFGFYLNGLLNMPYYFSLASNRPDITVRLNFLALFTTLPVTVLLTWQLGFTGAAASWVWYHLFAYAYVVPRISKECMGRPPAGWFLHTGRVLAMVAGTYGVAGLAVWIARPAILGTAVAYAVATLVFAAISWSAIGEDSRAAVREMKRAFVRPVRSAA